MSWLVDMPGRICWDRCVDYLRRLVDQQTCQGGGVGTVADKCGTQAQRLDLWTADHRVSCTPRRTTPNWFIMDALSVCGRLIWIATGLTKFIRSLLTFYQQTETTLLKDTDPDWGTIGPHLSSQIFWDLEIETKEVQHNYAKVNNHQVKFPSCINTLLKKIQSQARLIPSSF